MTCLQEQLVEKLRLALVDKDRLEKEVRAGGGSSLKTWIRYKPMNILFCSFPLLSSNSLLKHSHTCPGCCPEGAKSEAEDRRGKTDGPGERGTGRKEDRKTGRREDRKIERQEDRKTWGQEDGKTGGHEDRKTWSMLGPLSLMLLSQLRRQLLTAQEAAVQSAVKEAKRVLQIKLAEQVSSVLSRSVVFWAGQ